MSPCQGEAFQHWKEALLELGPGGPCFSTGWCQERAVLTLLCNWSHQNSTFQLTPSIAAVFPLTQQHWLWAIKHFCDRWGLSLLFYFLWKTQLPLGTLSPTPSVNYRNCNTEESWPCPALNCSCQQAAIPCFTPGSGRNNGTGILGLTSPHSTPWWLGWVTTGLPVSAWIMDGNKIL